MNEIWAKSNVRFLDDVPFYCMAPEHLLVFLCLHLAQHRFSRLLWFHDLSEVVQHYGSSFDWIYFLDCVKKWQLETYIYFPLLLARQMMLLEPPTIVFETIRPVYLTGRLFEKSICRSNLVNQEVLKSLLLSQSFPSLTNNKGRRWSNIILLPLRYSCQVRKTPAWRKIKRTTFWIQLRTMVNLLINKTGQLLCSSRAKKKVKLG